MKKPKPKKSPSGNNTKINQAPAKTTGSSGVVIIKERPLSPHLTIYKPQISSTLSISHRITGVFLLFGAILFSWWVISIACGADVFSVTNKMLSTKTGLLLLFCWTASLYYHFLNGVRHLFWDVGLGFNLRNMTATGFTVIIGSLVLTIFSWYLISLTIDLGIN